MGGGPAQLASGELGSNDSPIGLHRLQFGGEALRPDGLLEIVLPSFVLLAKKLANELLGALGDTREGGPLRIGGV